MDSFSVLLSVAEAASQEHSPADLVRISVLACRRLSCCQLLLCLVFVCC